MSSIKCLIIDDEKNAHYVLKNYIERHPDLELAGQFYEALTAIDFIGNNTVDLIFLDINMPGKDGFELIKELHTRPQIILTTAYSQFALKAYDHGVLDYLVKPIPYPRFEQAVQRYQQAILARPATRPKQEQDDFITLKTDQGMVDFSLVNIHYLQSWGNYIKLYTRDKTYLCTATTAEVERRLPRGQFIRIHKSYIVAIGQIVSFENDVISLKGPKADLPVGITYRRMLAETLSKMEKG